MREHWSLQARINAVLLMFVGVTALVLLIQAGISQRLVVHPVWQGVLHASSAQWIATQAAPLPGGTLRGWRLHGTEPPPVDMPSFLAGLAPGYYDESRLDAYESERSYAALITPTAEGRLVMLIDLTELENEQNLSVWGSAGVVLLNLLLIAAVMRWLTRSLRHPVRQLASRLDALDAEQPSQRLATDYAQAELNQIATGVNRHLARAERFIERERSLLDQASHEFRTPMAIIQGAADVLDRIGLPAAAQPPLQRIRNTVQQLTEIMAALLMLAREPDARERAEATRLDRLLPALLKDHEPLLRDPAVCFALCVEGPLSLVAPEALVRIVVANLLRNAAEHTHEGRIDVHLGSTMLTISDPGEGFDTDEAARRRVQAHSCDPRPGAGLGLGLFLVQRICERYGWALQIESEPARGTVCRLQFGAAAR